MRRHQQQQVLALNHVSMFFFPDNDIVFQILTFLIKNGAGRSSKDGAEQSMEQEAGNEKADQDGGHAKKDGGHEKKDGGHENVDLL
ncbi:hypothetical protein Tco_0094049 [Tanacetum coccineum]